MRIIFMFSSSSGIFFGEGGCNTHTHTHTYTADTHIQTFRTNECGMCDYTVLNLYSEYRVTLEG